MKRFCRNSIVLLLIAALLLCLCGCNDLSAFDDPAVRSNLEQFLDLLIADDLDGAVAHLSDHVDAESAKASMPGMRDYIGSVSDYELKLVGYYVRSVNGASYREMNYEMVMADRSIFISLVVEDGCEGICGIYLTPMETVTYSGSIGKMEGADASQWAVLLYGIACVIFVIAMAVDCFRRKPDKRWLWMIAIFAVLTLTVTISSTSSVKVGVGLMIYLGQFIKFSSGEMELFVVLPIGALIYLVKRRSLYAHTDAAPAAEAELPEEIVEREDCSE